MLIQISITAYKTIVIKEVLRFMRIWMQTILPPVVTTILYFVIFGELIGSQLDPVNGHTYIDYIVPGIILMSVLTHAYSNVVSSFYSTKFHHNIEELLVAPVPNAVIVFGYVTGGIIRGLVVGIVVTLVALCFTDFDIHHYGIAFSVLVLTATLFALGGFINAVFAKSFDDISIIPSFVLTPLTYLGGIFFSLDMLSDFWRIVSMGNPVLYMVNAFRYGLLGISDISITLAYTIIILFIGILTVFALFLLEKGIGIKP